MPEKAIFYGDIVNRKQRRRIRDTYPGHVDDVLWHDAPDMFESNGERSVVFVDLDDPAFADPGFLLSIATAGQMVKLIGKSTDTSTEQAREVARLGVSELLTSDQCLERLEALLKEAEQVPGTSDQQEISRYGINALIGLSEQIEEIRSTVSLLSEVDFPSALILGDTGTGKSLISKILHNSGTRARHNLVEVNCSAIPDELFETELFGHAKGAFTDAKKEKQGLFEYAEGGTLFLDEVGNLSASAQAKLLKVVEDKRLRKVGSVTDKDINVRVVAATNLDLDAAVQAGKFRDDLFYRLNLLTLEIPPLRERPDDIPELIRHYLSYYSTNYGKPHVVVNEAATNQLKSYHWPGNVRELCNILERAVLLSRDGTIGVNNIGAAFTNSRISAADRQQLVIDIPPQGITLQEVEQNVVKQILNMFDWNKSQASKFLGISRPRLRRIIAAAGLEQDRRQV